MSFASPCFKKSKELTEEDLNNLKTLSLDMKIVYTLMRIQEFYLLHKGKIIVSVTDGKSSKVLLHLARSKYSTLPSRNDTVCGIFHNDDGFNPLLIWNESDLDNYIKIYFKDS